MRPNIEVAIPQNSASSHRYTAGGIFTITVHLTDDDGGAAHATTVAYVMGAGFQNGLLSFYGTSGNDTMGVSLLSNGQILVTSALAVTWRGCLLKQNFSIPANSLRGMLFVLGDGNPGRSAGSRFAPGRGVRRGRRRADR